MNAPTPKSDTSGTSAAVDSGAPESPSDVDPAGADESDPLAEYTEPLPEPDFAPDPDQAWKALSNVNDWIKHADSKTGITVAAAGASGVMLYNLVKNQSDPGLWLSIFSVLTGIAATATAIACAIAILPRLTIDPRHPEAAFDRLRSEPDLSSLLFFSHIAKKYKGKDGNPTFVEVFETLTSDSVQLTRQIAQQVHANATVAHRKFRWTNLAIIALAFDYTFLAVVAMIVGMP